VRVLIAEDEALIREIEAEDLEGSYAVALSKEENP